MGINRREFGKTILFALAGSQWISSPLAGSDNRGESLVVHATSPLLKRVRNDIDSSASMKYVNRAMKQITGESGSLAAWKKLFSPHEKVGIKLSCLPGLPLSSSRGLVLAIVDSLREAGIQGKNIFVWERTNRELERAGFPIGQSSSVVAGTDDNRVGGYSNRIEFSGSVGTCFSRLMDHVDALINVPVLKDHDIAGISAGMKNFYGVIYNPNKFHANRCDPYVADLVNHPLIRNKLRLTVCDASRIQVNNGPAFFRRYAVELGSLLISRDPVALDYVGWQIIEQERAKMGMKSLKEAGREPSYILSAAKLGLGVGDKKKIRIEEIS